jgi:hypothetical protein
LLTYTIRDPSGDQAGEPAVWSAATWVSWRRPLPSGLMVNTWEGAGGSPAKMGPTE